MTVYAVFYLSSHVFYTSNLMLLKTIDTNLIDYDRKIGKAIFESENSKRD